MTDSGADTRAAQETAPAPVLPADETDRYANDGEIPAEKVGDGWRASPNGSADALDRRARMADWLKDAKDHQRRIRARRGDAPPINAATILNELREERIEQLAASGREFLETVKAHHRADKERRERERMESDNPDANLTADMINDMRDERDEQILSAVVGVC